MAAITLAVASLVVAIGSAYMQHQQAQKAARAQRNAAAVSAAEQRAQQQAQVRQQVRAERVRRAQIMQASQNDGVTGSSGAMGSESSLGSLIDGNLAALGRGANSATAISGYNQDAANAQGRANMWGAIGGVAQSGFGLVTGTTSFQNDFNNLIGGSKTPNKMTP